MISILRKNVIFAILISIIFLLVLTPTSKAENPVKVRLGLDVATDSLAFWIADSEGFFEKYGIEAVGKQYDIGFQGLLAIGAGEGDTSIQSEPPTIINISKGIDAIIVAVIARGPEGYKAVVKKEIKSPKDLIGKKVGVPFGSGGEYFMHTFLVQNGINEDQIKLVNGGPPDLSALLYKGEIDAAFFWAPWPRKTMGLQDAKMKLNIFLPSIGAYDAHFFLTVRRKFAEENPEAVKNILRALIEANEFMAKNTEKAIKVTKYVLRTSYEDATAVINDWPNTVVLDKDVMPALEEASAWLMAKGKIKQIPDWSKIIKPEYLREVDPSRVHISIK